MPEDYDRLDPTFERDLEESKLAVSVAAKWLSSKGYPVVVRPTFVRPDASKMSDFSDDGDIEIIQRVEVKRRQSLTFSSKEDFPYQTLIVDVAHAYDNARPKPYMYMIFNKEMTDCLLVECRTFHKWIKTTKYDRHRNRDRTFYECPIELVKWVKVER
jgi:hypothetical protein